MAENSNYFKIYEIVNNVLSDKQKINIIRSDRNKRLQKCDYTQLPDSGLSAQKVAEYKTYRQALRDLPETVNINNPIFPDEPK